MSSSARLRQFVVQLSSSPVTTRVSRAEPLPLAPEEVHQPAVPSSSGKGNDALLGLIVAPAKADIEVMNVNLKNIVGDRHPMLMAAAEQIFGAGGKKLRPLIVLLVARATASLTNLRYGQGRLLATF